MKRSIYYAEVMVTLNQSGIYADTLNGIQVGFVNLLANDLYQVGIALELDIGHLYLGNLINDTGIVRSQHLSTVLPVCLVTVVFTRVVAGGHVHAALATQITDCERYLRGGTQVIKQINLDAVCTEYVCYGLGEQTSVVAAVMSYDH